FGTGVGALVTPGGLRPQPILQLQLGYALSDAFTFELQLQSSVWPSFISTSEGSGTVGAAMLRALVALTPLRTGAFSLGVMGGTGAMLMWSATSLAADMVEPPVVTSLAWIVSAGLVAGARLSEGVRLQLLV